MEEMEEKDERHTGRRRLLRSAGAVAAGVAGAGVAGAVAATPAQAATGDPVLAGKINTADATTSIELTGAPAPASTPALRLKNASGPALTAEPVSPSVVSTAAPGGSLYIDEWGDIWTVADVNGNKFVHQAYSSTWATMTVPINSLRWLDTRGIGVGNSNVVPGSATISGGKIVPKGTNGPDLVLDFTDILAENYVAAQVIVSVHGSPGDGWLTLWGDGSWPGAVSVNFLGGRVIGGFAQCELTGVFQESTEPFGHMKLKITHNAAVTVDIVGVITPDVFSAFQPSFTASHGVVAAGTPKVTPRKR